MDENYETWNEQTKTLNLEQIDEDPDCGIGASGVWLKNVDEAAREISAVKDRVRSINLDCQEGCTEIPEVISECYNLEELNVCNTPVKELPDFVFRLPRLRVLKYYGCRFEKQPERIGEAQNLEELTMYVGK